MRNIFRCRTNCIRLIHVVGWLLMISNFHSQGQFPGLHLNFPQSYQCNIKLRCKMILLNQFKVLWNSHYKLYHQRQNQNIILGLYQAHQALKAPVRSCIPGYNIVLLIKKESTTSRFVWIFAWNLRLFVTQNLPLNHNIFIFC